MHKTPVVFSWSGGKDSTLALHHLLHQNEYDVRYLLTTISSQHERVSMHGVRTSLLCEQIFSLKIPLVAVELPEMPDMETYERELFIHLEKFKSAGIDKVVFGDLFLEDLKVYREQQLAKIGMKAIFPLWKKNSLTVIEEFMALGYQTIVVCAQDGLQDFCGRVIDQSFLDDLPAHIDPCGENGEFHTFVFDGPIFEQRLKFTIGERVYKTFPNPNGDSVVSGYWYVDLLPSAL